MEIKYYYNYDNLNYELLINNISKKRTMKIIKIYYIMLVISLLVLILFILRIASNGFKYNYIVNIIGILVYGFSIILRIGTLKITLRIIDDVEDAIDEEIIVGFSELEISEKNTLSNCEKIFKWNKIQAIVCDDKYLQLKFSRKQFLLLPFRAMDVLEKEKLFALLKNKTNLNINYQ